MNKLTKLDRCLVVVGSFASVCRAIVGQWKRRRVDVMEEEKKSGHGMALESSAPPPPQVSGIVLRISGVDCESVSNNFANLLGWA